MFAPPKPNLLRIREAISRSGSVPRTNFTQLPNSRESSTIKMNSRDSSFDNSLLYGKENITRKRSHFSFSNNLVNRSFNIPSTQSKVLNIEKKYESNKFFTENDELTNSFPSESNLSKENETKCLLKDIKNRIKYCQDIEKEKYKPLVEKCIQNYEKITINSPKEIFPKKIIQKISYDNGEIYEGNTIGTIRHGFGKLSNEENVLIYEGEWRNDKRTGFGKEMVKSHIKQKIELNYKDLSEYKENMVSYIGEFKGDAKWGKGTLKFADNSKFVGGFEGNFPNGEGVFITNSNIQFFGIWDKGVLK